MAADVKLAIGALGGARELCLGLLLVAFGCSASDQVRESVVEAHGLKISVWPVCADNQLMLNISMENVTPKIITIESGIPPWDFNAVVGTKFRATAGAESLEFVPAFTSLQVIGPIRLQSAEKQEGRVPIMELFPDIAEKLKSTPVSVQWSYNPASYKARNDSTPLTGTLEIARNPCLP